jgi:MFS family permease
MFSSALSPTGRKSVRPNFRSFLWLWFGQSVSLFGSSLTSFALGLWVYTQTGSVLEYSLIILAAALPRLLFSPLAGALVDRWDRRWMMILSDTGAALGTLMIVALLLTQNLQPGFIYLATVISAAFGAFQFPAYTAAATQIVPEEQLGRANGLVSTGSAIVEILTPTAAGFLVTAIGLPGILCIDFATFLFAAVITLSVHFPPVLSSDKPDTAQGSVAKGSLLRDVLAGWRLIGSIPGLKALLGFVVVFNFIWGMVQVLISPLVLGFARPQDLGLMLTAAGTGMLAGGLVMSATGGPKRKVLGFLLFEMASGVCFIMIGIKPWLWLAICAAFAAHFSIAIIDGSNKSVWQSRIPLSLQGRAFAVWQMAAQIARPLAILTAGQLADRVFNPLLVPGGHLAATVGGLLGTGPARGVGLMFVLMGLAKIATSGVCAANREIRALDLPAKNTVTQVAPDLSGNG